MAPKEKKRVIKKTILIVGEGYCEKAFLQHLKSIFSTGKASIKIVTAAGKGPSNIINHAISTKKHDGYDTAFVLLDTDIPWSPSIIREARKHQVKLIASRPCLEGLLLDILQIQKPESSSKCKEKMHKKLRKDPTDKDSYTIFNKEILILAKNRINELNELIEIFISP